MEGQRGEGCVDEDQGLLNDQQVLGTLSEGEHGVGYGAICLKYDARGNIYRH